LESEILYHVDPEIFGWMYLW